jgi:2-oxoglutarate dehydrogenase E2 component (dihydrolipoamide succinyltransferase)
MPTNVDVPALGESVREAVLIKWHKNDGDTVAAAEPVAELETDKANVDVPAPAAGVLRRVKEEGDTVAIGDTIARIDEGGAGAKTQATKTPTSQSQSSSAPKNEAKKAPEGKVEAKSETKPEDLRPSVRRIVEENKIDPSTIKGTAKGGQITKEDALKQVESKPAPSAPQSSAPQSPAPQSSTSLSSTPTPAITPTMDFAPDGTKRVAMSKIRKKIAERLVQAQQTAAILTTFNEVDMTAIMDLRAKFKEKFEKTYGVGLGFMSFFARASVLALREFPRVNAEIDESNGGSDVIYHNYVNLGIAVSTERGLAVPVLRNVDQMGFAKIESEIKRLAAATRDGKLALQELSGGTFTITNGGVFGSLLSTPIINPPQSGILGMHAIQKRPIAVGDKVEIHPMMYIALSYDHRLVDGRESVSFLVRLKEYLEDPARLMLEI